MYAREPLRGRLARFEAGGVILGPGGFEGVRWAARDPYFVAYGVFREKPWQLGRIFLTSLLDLLETGDECVAARWSRSHAGAT